MSWIVPSTGTSASISPPRPRLRLRRLTALGVVGAAVLACGGAPDSLHSSTTLTSAASSDEPPARNDLIRTEAEREDARHALGQCRDATSQAESELQIAREREAVAEKAWATIDVADSGLRALQLEATRAATVGARQKLETSAADTRERRAVVERDARKVYAHRGPAWARFKGSMEKSISDLERTNAANEALLSGMSP